MTHLSGVRVKLMYTNGRDLECGRGGGGTESILAWHDREWSLPMKYLHIMGFSKTRARLGNSARYQCAKTKLRCQRNFAHGPECEVVTALALWLTQLT